MTHKQMAYWFFYHHAGFSYNPKTETRNSGRRRCAAVLRRAESEASARGFRFEWVGDWAVGSHRAEYGGESEPHTCESCLCYDDAGKIIASLQCIDDADNNYRRVVEAELAAEALAVSE